jgi:gliding motility-associated-like protein
VASDGSDFRMLSPSGSPIPIMAETPINCIGNMTDSIRIKLYPPGLSENGTYFIWSKIGNDGNTLLNNCNNPMAEYDTAAFSFNNCYAGIIDLTNVSVDQTNTNMEIYWTAPSSLPLIQFHSFDIYRSDYPGGPYNTGITSVISASAGYYLDTSVNVPLKPYNYIVKIHLNSGYISPPGDSIQSIFLSGAINADSTTIALAWTPYWGWPGPVYRVMESADNGATFTPVAGSSTSNNFSTYTTPKEEGHYLVRVETSNGGSPPLVSRSNWYAYDVVVVNLQVIAPNVITPNGDGKNESFSFTNLDMYPNSKLSVFNRWGRKVYENGNYQNDWKGDNLAEGVYYYTLTVADKSLTKLNGTVNIIRNK